MSSETEQYPEIRALLARAVDPDGPDRDLVGAAVAEGRRRRRVAVTNTVAALGLVGLSAAAVTGWAVFGGRGSDGATTSPTATATAPATATGAKPSALPVPPTGDAAFGYLAPGVWSLNRTGGHPDTTPRLPAPGPYTAVLGILAVHLDPGLRHLVGVAADPYTGHWTLDPAVRVVNAEGWWTPDRVAPDFTAGKGSPPAGIADVEFGTPPRVADFYGPCGMRLGAEVEPSQLPGADRVAWGRCATGRLADGSLTLAVQGTWGRLSVLMASRVFKDGSSITVTVLNGYETGAGLTAPVPMPWDLPQVLAAVSDPRLVMP